MKAPLRMLPIASVCSVISFGIATFLCGLAFAAEPVFENVQLETPERIRTVMTGDFDNDGDADIVAAYVDGLPPAQTRLLTVFWQITPGVWERSDSTSLILPDEVALIDVGRIGGQDRIALLRYDGVDLVTFDGGIVKGTERIIDVDSIVFHGELGDVTSFDFVQDLFHDDHTHIVIPQWGRLRLFEETATGWDESELQVPQETRYIGGSLRHGFRQSTQSLQVTLTIPVFMGADVDGDSREDLVMHRSDNVFVYLRDESGALPSWPTHSTHFPVRTDEEKRESTAAVSISIADVNGDGAVDAVVNKLFGGMRAMQSNTDLFLGVGDGSFTDASVWSLKDTGYAASINLVDVDGDGAAEVVSPNASLGLLELSRVVLSGSIDLELRIYDADRGADDVPEGTLDFEVLLDYSAGARLKSPDPRYADFDGDGLTDLLLSRGSDTIEIYRSAGLDGEALIAVTTVPLSRAVRIFNDGADKYTDLLMFYPYDDERSRTIEVRRLVPQK